MHEFVLSDGFDRVCTGMVIVDHGSRRAASNLRHEEFVEGWRAEYGCPIVEPAHMECAEPSIATAFSACVTAGATTVVVAPYFRRPGNHWERDIPQLASAAAAAHPDVRYLVTAPLGPHPLLAKIVAERVTSCLAHAAGDLPACELCAGTAHCQFETG